MMLRFGLWISIALRAEAGAIRKTASFFSLRRLPASLNNKSWEEENNYTHKVRVVSDVFASLDQPKSVSQLVDRFSLLLNQMTSPEDDHHRVTHLVVAGGLLSFTATPSASTPRQPRELLEKLFSSPKSRFASLADQALGRLGVAIQTYVRGGGRFIWLPGSREFNLTSDLVSQFWRDANEELFMIPEISRFENWGMCVSSGRESDFFSLPIPSNRRPFSYYLDRLLADSEKPPYGGKLLGGLEYGIAQAVMAKAYEDITPSAPLSTLQLLDPHAMRRVLENAMKLASGDENLSENTTFTDGYWNIVMNNNGTFEDLSGVSRPSTVSVSEVLEQFEFLVQDWLAEVGEEPTSRALYTTAYDDVTEALDSLADNPELAVLGHTMRPVNMTATSDGVYILYPGPWYEAHRPGDSAVQKSLNWCQDCHFMPTNSTYWDIIIGKTFTGALRPLSAQVYYFSAEGESIPVGLSWKRNYFASQTAIWGIVAAGGALLAAIVFGIAFYAMLGKWKRDQKNNEFANILESPAGIEVQPMLVSTRVRVSVTTAEELSGSSDTQGQPAGPRADNLPGCRDVADGSGPGGSSDQALARAWSLGSGSAAVKTSRREKESIRWLVEPSQNRENEETAGAESAVYNAPLTIDQTPAPRMASFLVARRRKKELLTYGEEEGSGCEGGDDMAANTDRRNSRCALLPSGNRDTTGVKVEGGSGRRRRKSIGGEERATQAGGTSRRRSSATAANDLIEAAYSSELRNPTASRRDTDKTIRDSIVKHFKSKRNGERLGLEAQLLLVRQSKEESKSADGAQTEKAAGA